MEKSVQSKSEISSSDIVQKAVLIIVVLFSIHFWELKYIPQMINIENVLTWLLCGFSLIMVFQKDNLRFKYPILIFIAGIVLNSVAAYFNLGQSPITTFLSFEFYWFILIYFLLHFFRIDRKFLENVVIGFGLMYSFLYIYQYRIYPDLIFRDDPNTAEWSWQFEILGHGFLMLAYFLVLNRYLLGHRLIYIFMVLGFLYVLFRSDFRTLIAGAAVVTVFMVFRTIRKLTDFVTIAFVGLILVGFTQYKGVSKVINRMVNQTQENLNEGNKYIRFVELEYLYKIFPKNISYFIIGSGKPSGANLWRQNEGSTVSGKNMNYNIVWVDIGILGFYIIIGGIATLGMLWYTFKAIFFKLPRDGLYLNFYFLYLFVVSFTNEEIFRNGIFTVQAIGLYLIDIIKDEQLKTADKTSA